MKARLKIFMWKGKPIMDIEKWADSRGEKMVDVTWKKEHVNPYCLHANEVISYVMEADTMPESFWNTLRITEDNGIPVRVTKRQPKVKI